MSLETTLRSNPTAFVVDQVKFGASNLDAVCAAKRERLLSSDQYTTLTSAYLQGINSALRRCFPGDAMWNLKALVILAEDIPASEVDLEAERATIMQRIGLSSETTNVTTRQAYQHFLPYARYNGPTLDSELFESVTLQMTAYIAEFVRRGITERDPDQLERVIPMMRLLAYTHKAVEIIHYSCEAEFDEMTRWAVDQQTLQFIYLTKEQLLARGEVTSENMYSRR